MSGLAYAPPAFVNADGQRVIFVDFAHAKYHLEFDVRACHASAFSQITFAADAEGLPAISINQPVISACLDGRDVKLIDQYSPDGQTSFKILSTPVSPGIHVLGIKSELTNEGPYGHPIAWLSDPEGIDCTFHMSDLRRANGGYLESFLPSNHNFDHFRMSLSVRIFGTRANYSVFSNGSVSNPFRGSWHVEFPAFFSSSCPWFHLCPAEKYHDHPVTFSSPEGRTIPITIYTESIERSKVVLQDFADEAKKILSDLESKFGPFPHDSLVIFARQDKQIAMEYAGATATYLDALRHELDHSYFARCVIPANGDAGWIDEAIASWGDEGYLPSENLPDRTANLGGRSPYIRTTSRDAYTVGRDFLAYLDHLLRGRGGLKPFLKQYAFQKRHQSVTTSEFQELVEDYHGSSLQQLFETYVYTEHTSP